VIPLLVSVVIAAIGWPLMPTALQLAAPRYQDALEAVRWALILGVALAFSPTQVALYVLGKPWWSLIASLAGVASYGVALALLGAPSLTLAAFTKAMIVGRSVVVLATGLLHWIEFRFGRSG
jgi:xanthine/uracil permease